MESEIKIDMSGIYAQYVQNQKLMEKNTEKRRENAQQGNPCDVHGLERRIIRKAKEVGLKTKIFDRKRSQSPFFCISCEKTVEGDELGTFFVIASSKGLKTGFSLNPAQVDYFDKNPGKSFVIVKRSATRDLPTTYFLLQYSKVKDDMHLSNRLFIYDQNFEYDFCFPSYEKEEDLIAKVISLVPKNKD